MSECCHFEVGPLVVHTQTFFGWFVISMEWSSSGDPPSCEIYLPMDMHSLLSGLPWFSGHRGKWKE